MIETPHFKFPFSFTPDGARVQVTEQDSDDEVMDCLEVLLLTEQGERIELPDYGIQEQDFRLNGIDAVAVTNSVHQWEPRASILLETSPIEDLVQTNRLNFRLKGIDG